MFGFGSSSHLLIVLALALILIGPKQLPELARTLGRLLNELRRTSNMFTQEFQSQLREEEQQKLIQPESNNTQDLHSETYHHPHHEHHHNQEAEQLEFQEVPEQDVANATQDPAQSTDDEKKS